MRVHVFWNKRTGNVIVPTLAKTEAGYWLDIEPVELGSWSNPESVAEAVEKALARSGQVVPTPTRQNFPKPVVLPYSKARSINDFEKKYDLASIARSQDGYHSIERYKEAPESTGRVVDSDASTTYPPEVSLNQLISILASTIPLKTKDK